MRLRALLSGYPKAVIDSLDSCGIKTDADLLCSASSLMELWQRLPPDSITYPQLEGIREVAIKSLAADGVRGTDAPRNSEDGDGSGSPLMWTTTGICPELATLLDATQAGIIEVSGDKGSGKTALILNTAIACLESSKDSIVHWIDTTGDFSAERASRIFISGSWNPNPTKVPPTPSPLDRLHVTLAFTPGEAHAVLDSIRQQASASRDGCGRPRPIRLIVVDPVTPLFSPHISAVSSEGQAMLTAFMRSLQDLAQELGAIALVANNASISHSGPTASCFEATVMKPALGSTMTFLTGATIWLAPARSLFKSVSEMGGIDGGDSTKTNSSSAQQLASDEQNLDNVYIAEVLRSRSHVEPRWWSFKLDENGVVNGFLSPRRPSTP